MDLLQEGYKEKNSTEEINRDYPPKLTRVFGAMEETT
jgi:hypothetical protein